MVTGSHLPAYPGYRAPRPLARWRAFPFLSALPLLFLPSVSSAASDRLKHTRTLLRPAPCPRALFPPAATPTPRRLPPIRRPPSAPRRRRLPPPPHYLPSAPAARRPASPLSFPSPPNRRARVRVSLHPRLRRSAEARVVPVSFFSPPALFLRSARFLTAASWQWSGLGARVLTAWLCGGVFLVWRRRWEAIWRS